MTQTELSMFDQDVLRSLAGDKVFARGQAYFREGMVELLAIEPNRVVARVAGTQDYAATVLRQASSLDGECTCPAFERDRFCKHMVAAVLAADAAIACGTADSVGTLTRIRSYLRGKDIDVLVAMITDAAERDPVLFRRLAIAAAAETADGENLEESLQEAVQEACATRGFIDYARAGEWAAGVDAVLDAMADLASAEHAALVVDLTDYAITRIERAIENIDDSGGYCGDLLERAQQIHFEACQAARPDPVALAGKLYLRETRGGFGTFHGAVAQYAEILGDRGLDEYQRLAREAWDKLPPNMGPVRGGGEHRYELSKLVSILDFFAERDKDLEARIALRSKDLSSQWDYFRLATFCLEQGLAEVALRHAEEGLWLFEDERADERLVNLAVDLLLKEDRTADAEAQLWRAFRKAPNLDLYRRMRSLGGDEATRQILEHLQDRLENSSASRWPSPADLVTRIMIEEGMFEDAWATVRDHGASRGVKEALALVSERTHPQKALAVYAERVEELVSAGDKHAYRQAASLIERMRTLHGSAEHSAYVIAVRQRHGRKRNFMKLLG